MKTAILLICFLQFFYSNPPSGPATTPNPAYPLRVRILQVHRQSNRWGSHGFGRGDLMGAQPRGFDYTFDCDPPFLHNAQRGEFYQARWKKPDQKLELLTQQIGSNRTNRCDLQVTMKSMPYGRYDHTSSAASIPAPPAP